MNNKKTLNESVAIGVEYTKKYLEEHFYQTSITTSVGDHGSRQYGSQGIDVSVNALTPDPENSSFYAIVAVMAVLALCGLFIMIYGKLKDRER